MTRYASRFRRVARSLSRVALMGSSMDDTFALTEQELMDKDAGRRFLDYYGDRGLRVAFERYGLTPALVRRGWTDLGVETFAHAERHTLLVDGRSPEGQRERLIELVVRRDRLDVEELDPSFEVLTIDWLSLRNPSGSFTEERMRLPGQDAPGLGVGERVLEMLYVVVGRLGLDGLVTVPEYFHNAVLYSRELPYVDPWYEGQLAALDELLSNEERLSFAEAAWAMHWGHVRDAQDRVLHWRGEAMMRAMSPVLRARLQSEDYAGKAGRATRGARYHLAREPFEAQWRAEREELLRFPPPSSKSATPT